ncbi:protein NLP6-like [Olea europaea var. sylvestris]|uniref:NLP6 isoform X1 n=1 Tax=Olea europaea subsp. europaea TaxID=158383 RepID=A0A8S0T3V2_OLEEU|nr:protein NLP6-like [Olea europaea var. sylvestris]CAA2998436.1 NLP6 isoform X1 [Olea europaea subsp. europaea]
MAAFMMDLDLDLESSWSSDQIFTNLMSPFQLSNSEQPCSPLWAFNDEKDDCKLAGNSVPGGGFRLSNCSRHSPNPESMTENGVGNDDKRKLPSPNLGFRPIDNLDESCIVKERMTQALRYFKDLTGEHVLAQVWAPVKNGGRYVLTTSGQPFVLDSDSNGLHQYRLVSLMYMFSVDGETEGPLGLPGRVFWQRLPEWTPNVQYYSSKEFPRLDHALNYNVRGTLALPVFEPSRQTCVGVLELIMTSQKINYAPDVDKVCKALEAVNLKSSEILDHPSTQICNEGRQNALAEILEILTVVCENHTLPLAQTWIPCRHRNVLADGGGFKKICSSFDGSCMGQVCMSTTDVAYYVVDALTWGFREACAEHHLQKGQGVAGRAFASHSLCFCDDITQFCKTEYPLVHYARMFGLKSSIAICLRSTHTGNDDYVLEFFLPPNVQGHNDQRTLLDAVLLTMKQHFGSLRVASGNDLENEWRSIEITKASMDEKLNSRLDFAANSPPKSPALPNEEAVHLHSLEKQQSVGFNSTNNEGSVVSIVENKDTGKKSERKRGKAEKTVTLEVLQQYFAGSLKDAAKCLGVCPTTMKRICRQHGISRWPSRKINKVNRSLSKLKHVIESVHGGEGAFTLTSLATSSIPVAVGSISWSASLNEPNQQSSTEPIPPGGDDLAETLGTVELIPQKTEALLSEGSNRLKSRSRSREESTGSPTSHGSCQNNSVLGIENSQQNDPVVLPVNENQIKLTSSVELSCQPTQEINLSVALSIPKPNAFVTAAQEPFGGMLIDDAGSSHDLSNMYPAGKTLFDEHLPEYSWTKAPCSDAVPCSTVVPVDRMPQFSATPELKTITIKATYREDIIRFRHSLGSGIINLKEEVAKRLKLEVGTLDVKYLDDYHEWVLIACDADLQECIDISKSSGSNIVRLLVHDIMVNLGSSCESSGE